ncbi:hypothetical protein [Yinghuangia soli]|uniref:Uncharacterized protein n=1 Tax=Yinghuangia soli TaxID=2908204 RepID=A0AA41Q9E5_9ACTN|nr:hypothetical protein [Yinghuangia soli]MCF2533707.1 hypothetical protein [Yinghuangia soli]
MRTIVAGHMAFSVSEFAELAMGIDPELFTGPTDETPMERAARLDAAQDVLADLWREEPELAAFAEKLMNESAQIIELPTSRTAVGRWAA